MVLPFTLQMATRYWHGLHGTAKTQLYTDVNYEYHTLSREARQKSVTRGWDCFLTLCWLDFSWFAFYPNVMIIRIWVLFFSQASRNKIKLDLMALCALCKRVWAGQWVWPWVRSEASSVTAHAVYTARACSSPEWYRRHKTVLFNLKSAGFKALCWQ